MKKQIVVELQILILKEIRYLLSNTPIAIKEDISIEAMYVRPTILEFKDFRCSGHTAFETGEVDI